MSKPLAVLTSDVHYGLSTLSLADTAFRMAIDKAAELGVDLIDCGDLTNDKDILRGKVVNALIKTMEYAQHQNVRVRLLVGNHSLLNEKGRDHALNFLKPYCEVIEAPRADYDLSFIPYQSTPEDFVAALALMPKDKILLIHQGVTGSAAGHYIQDHSAVHPRVLEGYRSVGGHYHTRQSIGNHSFIGNAYTLTFAEANDPDKGFRVLYDDGSLDLVPTFLRKHITIERTTVDVQDPILNYKPGDLLWMKVTGTQLELDRINKQDLGMLLIGHSSFKLDKMVTDQEKVHMDQTLTRIEVMDTLIDTSTESAEEKLALKSLYREIL